MLPACLPVCPTCRPRSLSDGHTGGLSEYYAHRKLVTVTHTLDAAAAASCFWGMGKGIDGWWSDGLRKGMEKGLGLKLNDLVLDLGGHLVLITITFSKKGKGNEENPEVSNPKLLLVIWWLVSVWT